MMQDSQARRVLWGNAVFSAVSGGLCSLASTAVALFIGVDAPVVIMAIGMGLLAYAVLIAFYAMQPTVSRTFVLFAAIADTVWVALSALLLVTNIVLFSITGVWAVVIVAIIVGGFAVVQYRLVRGDRSA